MGNLSFTRLLLAAVVLLSAPHVCADTVSDSAFNRFRSQVLGNKVNFSFGSGGTPLAGGGSTAGTSVSGGVDISRGVSVPTKHGPIVGSVSQKISGAAMGKAFGRAAAVIGGPVGLAFLALPAIVDWMTDAGVRPAAGGGFEASTVNPALCYSAPCNDYAYQGASYGQQLGPACAAFVAFANGQPGPYGTRNPRTTAPRSCTYDLFVRSNNGFLQTATAQFTLTPVAPSAPTYSPLDEAALSARMGAATNPSPEALAELYKLAGPLNVGHPIPDLVDTLRADFDARSPESTETTTAEKPTETKTQEKTCATYTQVVGSTLSLVEQCSTTTTTQALDPVTGDPVGAPVVETVITGDTTPDPAVKPDPSEETQAMACGVSGTPPCDVKVNEAGTPTGETFGSSSALNDALSGREAGLGTARDMAGDTSWGIIPAWTEDRACEPWHIFTLPQAVGGADVGVDLCPLMPLADGILNFIWVMVGIFAVTSMVARAMTGGGT